METRNLDLEAKFSEVTRTNLELQRTERVLRDQLLTSADRAELEAAAKRTRELEEVECELR